MPASEPPETVEDVIRAACERDDAGEATRLALEAYGSEILRYLVSLTRDAGLADEAFSLFCEHLWRGLPRFRWESRLRPWAYVVARNALNMIRRQPHRRRPVVPLSDPGVGEIAERLRTTTAIHLRTEIKDAVARLRQKLEPFDQEILVLRIGRRMSWLDIARIVRAPDEEPDAADLKREAARLRKRFERAKAALEALVREEGLGQDAP